MEKIKSIIFKDVELKKYTFVLNFSKKNFNSVLNKNNVYIFIRS